MSLDLSDIAGWFPWITNEKLSAHQLFHVELLRCNKKLNLVSPNTIQTLKETHFADCLGAVEFIKENEEIVDIGSGNGFPGIVLATILPASMLYLVEVDGRKAEFWRHIVFKMKLQNARVVNKRIQDAGLGEKQAAVSRAFSSLRDSIDLADKIFSPGFKYFHLKGDGWIDEVGQVGSPLEKKWKVGLSGSYALPLSKVSRHVVLAEKIK